MERVALTMQNKIIVNRKTNEELFLHCSSNHKTMTMTIKRMKKKKRSGTVTMQISNFSTFARDVQGRILSEPVFIGGHRWRILALQ